MSGFLVGPVPGLVSQFSDALTHPLHYIASSSSQHRPISISSGRMNDLGLRIRTTCIHLIMQRGWLAGWLAASHRYIAERKRRRRRRNHHYRHRFNHHYNVTKRQRQRRLNPSGMDWGGLLHSRNSDPAAAMMIMINIL